MTICLFLPPSVCVSVSQKEPVLRFLSPRCFTDLIQASQETTINVPQMADTLMERAGNASWVVVFKALITTHHLMVHGNEVSMKKGVDSLMTCLVCCSRNAVKLPTVAPSGVGRGICCTVKQCQCEIGHCRTRASLPSPNLNMGHRNMSAFPQSTAHYVLLCCSVEAPKSLSFLLIIGCSLLL